MTHEAPRTAEDKAWADRWSALYKADTSARYHRRRQRFFDLADKLTKALTVLLGATLMGSMLKDSQPLAASLISSLSLLALVFAYSDRKQVHKELAEGFIKLIQQIEECPANELSEAKAAVWMAMAVALDAKEPPALKTLVTMCEHEASVAAGHPNHISLPSWHRRLLADFF